MISSCSLAEIEVALSVEEIEERELEALRQRRPRGERLPSAPARALIGRVGTRSSAVSRKITFLCP
jgi:hypothetical protein